MRSKISIIIMIAAWILFIALDSTTGFFRAWYLRKMKNPFRLLYHFFRYFRAVVLFSIAILNFGLIVSHSRKRRKN